MFKPVIKEVILKVRRYCTSMKVNCNLYSLLPLNILYSNLFFFVQCLTPQRFSSTPPLKKEFHTTL